MTAAVWLAMAFGAFQRMYLEVHFVDTRALRHAWIEVPFRRIAGLRPMLHEVSRRTRPGDRVLVVTPHRPWQGGYGYAFRRAQYVLAGREVIPLLDRDRDRVDPRALERATHVACWRECPPLGGFEVVWRSADGTLLRRAR